jgi:cardiolipin synthase
MARIVEHLPNILSWARLSAMPVTVWCLFSGHLRTALAVFAAAAVSDALDGYLARRLHRETDLGKLIDPLADKLLLAATYLSLSILHQLPWWLTIMVLGRDILIAAAYAAARLSGAIGEPAPLRLSKLNTGCQLLLAVLVLASMALAIEPGAALTVMVWVTAVFTAASWLQYFVVWITTRGTMQNSARP